MNESDAALPEMTPEQMAKKWAKMRRWLMWTLGQLGSIEGQATHRIDECLKIEARLAAKTVSASPPGNGEPKTS